MTKQLLLFSILALSLFTNTTKAQWVQLSSPTTGKLEGIYFVNNTTGYIAGAFTNLYKTTNGGTTWTSLGGYSARDLWFINENVGYSSSSAGSPNGNVKKTINGGVSWTQIVAPGQAAYWGVCATSASTAYFINTERKVQKTTDGGVTYNSILLSQLNASWETMTDIYFPDANTGYICTNGGNVIKTANAGTTWTSLTTNTTLPFQCMYFLNSTTGYVAGDKILKTTDGGTTWVDKSIPGNTLTQAIHFSDENNGLAVGLLGTIFRTADGGTTWIEQYSGTTKHLRKVFYLDANTAIIIGDNGIILKNSSVLSSTTPNIIARDINIYPNPISETTTVNIPDFDIFTDIGLEIYDLTGKLLRQEAITSNNFILDRKNLVNGNYLLRIYSSEGTIKTFKIVLK